MSSINSATSSVAYRSQLSLTSKQTSLSQSQLNTLQKGSARDLESLVQKEPFNLLTLAKSNPQALAHLAKTNPEALETLFKQDTQGLQTLLKALGLARPEAPAAPTGIVVDKEKQTASGSAQSTFVDGQRMVDVPGFGSVPAPDPGQVSSFLLAENRLMSLTTDANGLVKVSTRELGLEPKGSGFKGDVLPDPTTGKVMIGEKEIDVSGLKPGKTKKVKIKINGKKYKVKLKMNADGSVSVEGKRSRGFFGSIVHGIGKAISFVSKFSPLLMAIPGGALAATIGKIISVASSVKGFIDSVKTGNFLGAFGSLAGAVASFASGAVSSVANTLSKVAGFGQSVVNAFKYGLGNGLLPIVANGANLLSGAAGIFGKGELANVAGQVATYASVTDSALKGDFGPALQQLVNQFGPDIIKQIKEQQKKGVEYFIHEGVKIKPSEFALPDFDWSTAEFSTLPPGSTSSGSQSQYDRARQSLDPNASSFSGVGLVAGGRIVRQEQIMSRPSANALNVHSFGQQGDSANVTGRINNAGELAQYVFAGYNNGQYGPISIVPATLNDPKAKGPQLVHVVGISGTAIVDNQATGWDTNLRSGFQQDNDMLYNAREAIKKAVPPRAGEKPLLVLSGHSQGGMIAQQLASDKFIKDNYTVVSTVAFGSPLISFGQREGEVHRIAAFGDPVPRLSAQSALLYPVGSVGQQNIGATSVNPIKTHNTAYTDESKLGKTDALGRVGGGATIQFNPQNRRFFTAPPSYMVQQGRA
jgi:hypothetical protein